MIFGNSDQKLEKFSVPVQFGLVFHFWPDIFARTVAALFKITYKEFAGADIDNEEKYAWDHPNKEKVCSGLPKSAFREMVWKHLKDFSRK